MTDTTEGFVRRESEITDESVDAADGLSKGVLVDEEHGAPNLALRRFVLDPGATVPEHTNDIEHEQHVLAGEYVVGIGDTEYTVSAGDTVHIPANTVHWYRNDAETEGVFLCAVPVGDDEIKLVDDQAETAKSD
jgi:quercetin dioxygenase-like cupin family protein